MSTPPPERPSDPGDAFGEGRGAGGFEPPTTQSGDLGATYGGGGAATAAPGTGPTPGKATASLVLGIVGLVFCPVICSVLAIVFGRQAKAEIGRNPSLGGASLANAGVILGWVGVALTVLAVIFYTVVIAAS